MAKRLILSIIFGGCLVLVAHLIFALLPLSAFPCTQTQGGGITTAQLCSLRDINAPGPDGIYELTKAGQILQFLTIYVVPVVLGFVVEFRPFDKLRTRS